MTLNTQDIIKNWKISYNPYSDLFQIFNKSIFEIKKNNLIKKRKGYINIVFDRIKDNMLMIEIKDLYSNTGINVESMNKLDIIRGIEPYIYQKYGKSK